MTFLEQFTKYATSTLKQLDAIRNEFSAKIDEAKEAIKAQIPQIKAGDLESAKYALVSINSELRTYISGCYGHEGMDSRTDSVVYGLVKSIQRHKILGGSE